MGLDCYRIVWEEGGGGEKYNLTALEFTDPK